MNAAVINVSCMYRMDNIHAVWAIILVAVTNIYYTNSLSHESWNGCLDCNVENVKR